MKRSRLRITDVIKKADSTAKNVLELNYLPDIGCVECLYSSEPWLVHFKDVKEEVYKGLFPNPDIANPTLNIPSWDDFEKDHKHFPGGILWWNLKNISPLMKDMSLQEDKLLMKVFMSEDTKSQLTMIEQPTQIIDPQTKESLGVPVDIVPTWHSIRPILGCIALAGKKLKDYKQGDWVIVKDEPRDSLIVHREALYIVPEHYVAVKLGINGDTFNY